MEDSAVWKALADDTRRQMLDSLKVRPTTTGELCEEFPHLDRCTIMKHICVLENSKLITFRRQGRHRLNFLNSVQLQQIHTRWLNRYTANTADRLLDLKRLAERNAPAMPIDNLTTLETRAVKYAFEVEINAPAEKVWDLLTGDSSSWFPDTFRSSPKTKGFIMEHRVGGAFYEDHGDGNGRLLGNVIALDAPNRVQIQGPLAPEWGGPGMQIFAMELVETATGCTFKFDDSMFGHIPDEVLEGRNSSFRELFGVHLKRAAEA